MRSPMSVLLLLVSLVLAPVVPAFARGGEHADAMIKELQLTEEQAKAVRQIMQEKHDAFRALKDAEGDRASKKSQMEALHVQTKQKLAKVLNPDQMKRMEAMRKDHHGKDSRHEEHAQKLKDELKLNNEQAAAASKIMGVQHEKMRALLKSGEDRETLRPKLEALHNETRTQLAAVLDQEQMAKMDEMWKKHREHRKELHEKHMDGKDKDEAPKEPAAN